MTSGTKQYELSERGNAERIVDEFSHSIRYCIDSDRWYIWGKKGFWIEQPKKMIILQQCAMHVADNIRFEAKHTSDPDKAKELFAWAKSSETAGRLSSVFKIVAAEPELHVSTDDFDSDNWLLNVRNGIVDLRTGELRKHCADELMTKQVPVNYLPVSGDSLWSKTLHSVFQGDADLMEYFQKAIGYAISGEVSEKAFFILHGPSSNNGKSSVMNIIREVLGDYASEYETTMLLSVGRNGAYKPRGDIARLNGVRVAVGEELEGDKPLNTALFKKLTSGGNTVIEARDVYQAATQFLNTATLFLSSNAILSLSMEPAIEDRIHVIPFNTRYVRTQEEVDALRAQGETNVELMDMNRQNAILNNERSVVLNWIIEGCLKWQREGLVPPPAAVEAKANYVYLADTTGLFIDECCELNPGLRTAKMQIYAAYQAWCSRNGERPLANKALAAELQKRGIVHGRIGGNGLFCFVGIGLR